MEVKKFERWIRTCRIAFRKELDGTGVFVDTTFKTFKEMFKSMLEKCCSEFEEQTLKENLQEEFRDYMNSLQKTEGA